MPPTTDVTPDVTVDVFIPDTAQLVEAELVLWDNEPPLPRRHKLQDGQYEFNDPLEWWKEHESKFVRLAQLARKYLAIPATSAPSERLFSSAGLTIAKERARLTQDNAAMLIFLHENVEQVNRYRSIKGMPTASAGH